MEDAFQNLKVMVIDDSKPFAVQRKPYYSVKAVK